MNHKSLKRLKWITIFLVMILGIECLYVGYSYFFPKKTKVYFDGINDFITLKNEYVAVGSNNDNDMNLEKAKISKYNQDKEKTYEKLYNVGYNSAFFGIVEDEDTLVAVGSYEKTKEDHDNSVRRALIVKYDSSGEIVFEKDFSLLDNSKFTKIIVVSDGYFVIGQSVYKNTRVGAKEGGAILVKYDKDGNFLWSQNFGNSKEAIFNDLLLIQDSIYIVGSKDSSTGVIMCYSTEGNLLFEEETVGVIEDGYSGIISDGEFLYITGTMKVNEEKANAILVKYNLGGEKIGEVQYQDENRSSYLKPMFDSEDYIVVIGSLSLPREDDHQTVSSFNLDGLIGKYTKELKEVSVVSYGDEKDDYFTDITMENNDYMIVGYSSFEEGSYYSKFIRYSNALKLLGVSK